MRAPIQFPWLGILAQNQTPIIDTIKEYQTKQVAIICSSRTAPVIPRGPWLGFSKKKYDASIADPIDVFLKEPTFGSTSLGGFISYTLGTNLISMLKKTGDTGWCVNDIRAPMAGKLHEDFHLTMWDVARKYGQEFRLRLAARIVRTLPKDCRSAAKRLATHFYYTNHFLFNEELLAMLHVYMNCPSLRQMWAKQNGFEGPPHLYTEDTLLRRSYRLAHKLSALARTNDKGEIWFEGNWGHFWYSKMCKLSRYPR